MRLLRTLVPAIAIVAAFFAGATWQGNRIASFCAAAEGELIDGGPLCVVTDAPE